MKDSLFLLTVFLYQGGKIWHRRLKLHGGRIFLFVFNDGSIGFDALDGGATGLVFKSKIVNSMLDIFHDYKRVYKKIIVFLLKTC